MQSEMKLTEPAWVASCKKEKETVWYKREQQISLLTQFTTFASRHVHSRKSFYKLKKYYVYTHFILIEMHDYDIVSYRSIQNMSSYFLINKVNS